jgi:hypothetical protein
MLRFSVLRYGVHVNNKNILMLKRLKILFGPPSTNPLIFYLCQADNFHPLICRKKLTGLLIFARTLLSIYPNSNNKMKCIKVTEQSANQ